MSERDMSRLIALLEKRLGVQWADVVEWLRKQNSLDALEAKLVNGRLDDVIAEVTTAAEKFAAEVHHAYVAAGVAEASYLDAKVADTLVRFDSAYPSVVARARQNTYEQVYGLTTETRATVRSIISEGVREGAAPRETARRIRDSIGLTQPQERALENYRRSLEQGDWSRALSYELSSGQTDRTVMRLQRDGGHMTQAQIEAAVTRYRENSIAHRAETIARTESLAAAHQGADDAIRQAIDRGDVAADELVKEWHAGTRTRYARAEHRALDGKTVAFGEDFDVGGVRMSYPGDPRGGAGNVANCRCTVSVTFKS